MTVPLSPPRISKLLRHYFRGLHQIEIAKKAGVSQPAVSSYASRFRDRAERIGLLPAAKEVGLLDEVGGLRSLAVELAKAQLTVDDATKGLHVQKVCADLGVDPEQVAGLVELSNKTGDSDFLKAALKLSKLEKQTANTYEDAISKFEKAESQLPALDKKIAKAKNKLKTLEGHISEAGCEASELHAQISGLKEARRNEQAALDSQLSANMTKLGVKEHEIKEVAELKKLAAKSGADIPTLLEIAREVADA